jgi:hypothetical protein
MGSNMFALDLKKEDCMAIAALPNTTPAAALTAAAAPEITCLQRMTENLDPQRIQAEEDIASRWSFAAKATAVFFSVLALGGVIATAVLLSHLVVPAALAAVGLLGGAAIAYYLFQDKAEKILEQVAEPKAISAHLASFTSPLQIQQYLVLNGIGFVFNRPLDLLRLKPFFAYHQYYKTQFEQHSRLSQQNSQDANRLTNELAVKLHPLGGLPLPQAESDILALRNDSIKCGSLQVSAAHEESKARYAKIQMAFITGLIHRPEYTGTLETLGEALNPSPLFNGDADRIFVFRNRNLAPITVAELRQVSVAVLGERFAAAMV